MLTAMNKILIFIGIVIISFFFPSCANSQTIKGDWVWSYQDDKHETEVNIIENGSNSFLLKYCSTFEYGNKLDCGEESDKKIQLTKISNNVYEGVFKSYYSGATGKVRITLINNSNLKIEIINEPNDEYYFPKSATFTRL